MQLRSRDQSDADSKDSSESSTSDDDIPLAYRGNYIGKDETKCKMAKHTQSIRTREQNIATTH